MTSAIAEVVFLEVFMEREKLSNLINEINIKNNLYKIN
jgi:hypothetical protein